MQPPLWKIHGALFLAAFIYGASYSISKAVMPYYVPPLLFILIRLVGSLPLLALYRRFMPKEPIQDKKDFLRMVACAAFGVGLNMVTFFQGLAQTSPIHASLIMVTTPLLVLLIGFALRTERLSLYRIAGILLGTLGASMIIVSRGDADRESSLIGDLFILVNATSYAVYLVIVRPLLQKYSAMTITYWTFIIGTVLVAPLAIPQFPMARFAELDFLGWMAVVFIIVCTTFMTYTLNAYALQYVKSSVVGSYVYLQPVLGIFIAVAFAHYALQPIQLLYAAFIFGGVYLAGRNN